MVILPWEEIVRHGKCSGCDRRESPPGQHTRRGKQSEYAPLALYQAALILERQGLDRQLREANDLLEVRC